MINNEQAKQIVSSNLQRILESRGLSQADLARLMFEHVDTAARMMVNRWVKGTNPPTTADIVNLADALHCSTDDLLRSKKIRENSI